MLLLLLLLLLKSILLNKPPGAYSIIYGISIATFLSVFNALFACLQPKCPVVVS